MKTLMVKCAMVAASLVMAASAYAGIGTSSANDAHLDGSPADDFAYMDGWNPQAGPNGDTSGFASAFSGSGVGSWTLLGKMPASPTTWMSTLKFTYSGTGNTGLWTVENLTTNIITLDLVMAIHAGNQGGAWLFDDQTILPGQTLNGDWTINWLVGAKQQNHPDFSNMTLFGRDMIITQVPEPETYAMLLAGLAGLGFMARRKGRAT
ncbi:PEP-CTERM sorting domain-containing protein [Massilia endophytica]|uniref:PEP-CTERM sorting domain-containing protein n=1 Tax=Massilia endophytica TaxID=2899220 RepID=UPI001E3AA5A0|nr:PEP-CTERM sorting domain-containing protein [Massilia endophytica]UGQ47403.1 PEP-CTERM sorting domain-containing protein [Massilia endophytica]